MTAVRKHTPEDLEFAPRRPEFTLEQALATDWYGGSAFCTAWFNAMSMLFPLGEKFFIDSVRAFRHRIDDPALLRQVTAFQGQEAVHRLEHQRYNELLCELRGYDIDEIEAPLRRRIAWAHRELSAERRLAGTTANEHLTAILANDMLERPDLFDTADPEIAALWLWHGIEETEHKGVAFDVYMTVCGDTRTRRQAMLLNTWFFFKDTFRILRYMLRKDGKLWRIREWVDGLRFLFVKPGFLRAIFRPYLRFYRRDFHPWQHDNRQLIRDWERRFPEHAGAAASTDVGH